MTVIGKRVWAKRVLYEVQVGSFVLAGTCRDMNPLFLVLGVGDVDGIAVGDKVVCRKYAGQAVGDEEYIFNEEDVLCVVYD